MKEEWKEIRGYEGLYEVSNLGNVASLNYANRRIRQNLVPVLGGPYYRVKLAKNKQIKRFAVHRLVMNTFDKVSNLHIDHKDQNKLNNRLDNLEYVSVRENTYRYYQNKNGFCGATWSKKDNTWISFMRINGKQIRLGSSKDREVAIELYNNKLKQLSDVGA